jgi:hypothetical protein
MLIIHVAEIRSDTAGNETRRVKRRGMDACPFCSTSSRSRGVSVPGTVRSSPQPRLPGAGTFRTYPCAEAERRLSGGVDVRRLAGTTDQVPLRIHQGWEAEDSTRREAERHARRRPEGTAVRPEDTAVRPEDTAGRPEDTAGRGPDSTRQDLGARWERCGGSPSMMLGDYDCDGDEEH